MVEVWAWEAVAVGEVAGEMVVDEMVILLTDKIVILKKFIKCVE